MRVFMSLFLVFTLSVVKGQNVNFKKFGIDTSKPVPQGLKVGDKAPANAFDQNGNRLDLNKLIKKGPVVLFFYRGYWCPRCNKQLQKFQDSLQYLTAKGATVIAVSPQTLTNSERIIHKHDVSFHVISDTTDKIMHDYDVLFNVTKAYQDMVWKAIKTDIRKVNEQEAAQLPIPATFIINRKGKIVYRQFNYDYYKRATVKEVLEHLPKKLYGRTFHRAV